MITIGSFALLLPGLGRLASRLGDRSASLRELDARTLADIGVDRSEIASIEAEWLGHIEVTRRRIALPLGEA